MSDFDVDIIETMGPLLSDTDADALIAGHPVAGIPSELAGLLSVIRETATTGPAVPLSAELSDFLGESVASVTPIRTVASTAVPLRRRSLAKKAAAGFAIVPAKILIGAAMAAAAVGGAQTFGVVDLPVLPGPGSNVVSTVPAETVPSTTLDGKMVPDVSSVDGPTELKETAGPAPGSTTTTRSAPVVVPASSTVTVSATVAASTPHSSQTVPIHGGVDVEAGCELGQQTSGRRGGESDDGVPVGRPHGAKATAPSSEPCDEGVPERAPTSAPVVNPSSAPVERDRDNGAPPSVPGDTRKDSGVPAAPGRETETESSVGGGNGVASDPSPDTDQRGGSGQSDTGRVNGADTEPSKNPGRGRTPSGG